MDSPTDTPELLPAAIQDRARREPLAVAIEGPQGALTYGELAAGAREVAACLAAHGAGPKRPVLVCLAPSLELAPALVGVLASGAAYVPVDPRAPAARLVELARDADVCAVVTVSRLASHCAGAGVPVIEVDELPAARAPALAPEAHDRCYVLYTSGSTGRPKGVEVEHRSLAAFAHGMARHYELSPKDRVLQFASIAFDVAAEELYPTWIAGGTVVLRDDAALASFAAFTRFVAERRITVVNLPAGFWQQWTDELARSRTPLPGALRLVVAGSERASASALSTWKSLFGERVRWINGYGPTETTVTATTYEPRAGDVDPAAACVPIGFPLPWVEAYVLDAQRRPVAAGTAGELAIGGAGVARGYLGSPELTAERFVPDPFSRRAGARLYLTGDRARARSDGALEFLGRDDDQVKLRGYRIELAEVEAALERVPGVRAAAAALREDAPGARELCGYVVAAPGATLDPERVREALARELPEHMVPARIETLERLPRTHGGKLDRRALPAPMRAALGGPARGATEILLAELWSGLLGRSEIGRGDHFFRLGGHSLLAMQLAGRLAERGIELAPRAVFEHPTLAELAGAIDAGGANPWPPYPPLARADRSQRIPLSLSQEPVWFLLQLEPGLLAYNTQFSVRFAGAIDPAALRRALAMLVERHEILRTTFQDRGEGPEQEVHAPWTPELLLHDLSGDPPAERAARAEELCDRLCRRRFDVGALPLVEWTLLKHAPEDWELVQVEHHFVHDGWSIALLFRELSQLYADALAGRGSSLPVPPFQFADYVAWQRAMLAGERRERLVAFWRERLRGAPARLALPTDRPRPALQTFAGASEVLSIPPALWRSVAMLARREGFTPFQLFLTAFELLLLRHSGQEDLVLATAAANRRTREVESILGMLVNPVPIRVDAGGDPTVRELARRVQQSALESFEHQDLPFEHVVHAVQPPRDFSANPVFQVLFSFHDSPVPDLDFGGARGRMVYRYNGSAKFDMNLVVIPRGEQRVGREESDEDGHAIVEWEYNTDLYDRVRVQRMAAQFRSILEQLEAGFDAPCSAVSVATDEERSTFARWNATRADFAPGRGLCDLVREQAQRTPDAPAASAGGSRASYRELEELVERARGVLAARGVERGDLVGVHVERSLGMLVALLAISACGAAWLPLDPALPKERLAYLVGDAFQGAPRRLVVTQASLCASLPADLPTIDLAELAEDAPRATAPLPARGQDLAYVIYTSGSTGRPKGVEVTQANLVNFLCSMQRRLPLAQGDVLLAVTTLSFDIAGLELWLPLCSGAAVAIATREQSSDGASLSAALERERATCLQATPATWRMLLEAGWRGSETLTALCGGEALPLDLARAIAARSRRALNLYGPTETTIWSTLDELERDAEAVTIGRPLDNTLLYVLGPRRELLPLGASGELWIGGAGVARGYRARSELTAERFLPDPFAAAPGARIYATGDLARWRADGRVEYLGRLDNQVKLRGFRIELGEIEAALRRQPGVADCAVDLRELAPGDQRLVAWVVAAGAVDGPRLREALARELPEYMLPSCFARLEALPRTHNGKLDRKALAIAGAGERPGGIVPPRGEIEEGVAEVWREVLQTEAVGARDRFFDLGGHSLLAMRAITRLEQRFGVRVPPRDLLLQSLSQLAAAIAERRARGPEAAAGGAPAAPRKGILGALRGILGERPERT